MSDDAFLVISGNGQRASYAGRELIVESFYDPTLDAETLRYTFKDSGEVTGWIGVEPSEERPDSYVVRFEVYADHHALFRALIFALPFREAPDGGGPPKPRRPRSRPTMKAVRST